MANNKELKIRLNELGRIPASQSCGCAACEHHIKRYKELYVMLEKLDREQGEEK